MTYKEATDRMNASKTTQIPPWDNPKSECYGCKEHSIFDCKKCTICVYKAQDEPNCHMCPAFNSCIYSAVDNLTIRCVHYGRLKSMIDKTIDKLCSVKEVYQISADEIKTLVNLSLLEDEKVSGD